MAKKLWITLKCGLIEDPKHRRAMGEAFWLYAYMLNQAEWTKGIVRGWKDEDASRDLEMPVRTVVDYRRRLAEARYITCTKRQYSQDITIHNWTNPREYTGKVYNRQRAPVASVSDAQSDTMSDSQTSTQDVGPTSSSNKELPHKEIAAEPRAKDSPELVLFRSVTQRWPQRPNWPDVIKAVQAVSRRLGREATSDDLAPFLSAWTIRGWRADNLAWLTEWAVAGKFPTNGSKPRANLDAIRDWAER